MRRVKRLLPLLVLVGGVAAVGVGLWLAGQRPTGCRRMTHLLLQFAGSDHIEESYDCWKNRNIDDPSLSQALFWDWVLLIPAYTLFIYYWCRQCLERSRPRFARGASRFGAAAVIIAGLLDAGENGWLWQLDASRGTDGGAASRALAFAVPKWLFLSFASFMALQGVVRWVFALRARPQSLELAWTDGETAWERNTALPPPAGDDEAPNIGPPQGMGVAMSGGGIRSAVFSMGALQALQESALGGARRSLDGVRYISAVSGGGYFAGARQLVWNSDQSQEPFLSGSKEVEFVRRNGDYIADSFLQWMQALARVLVGLLINAGFLLGLIFVVGVPTGWIQQSLLFRVKRPDFDTSGGMWGSVAITIGVAIVSYLLAVLSRPRSDASGAGLGDRLYRLSAVFAVAAIACLALIYLLPEIILVSQDVTDFFNGSARGAAAGGGVATVLTWLGLRPPGRIALGKLIKKLPEQLRTKQDALTKDPKEAKRTSWVARLRVARWLPGVLLAITSLYVFARFAHQARGEGIGGDIPIFGLHVNLAWLWAGTVLTLLLLYAFGDQTTWSLYPYYKRRLATAFALERMDNIVGPRPYREPTPLDDPGSAEGPMLILGAAANVSGTKAPPGRRALSFSFTRDWIGGPEIGYMAPAALRQALGRRNDGDATLLSAMAMSGAALASAMGRHSMGSLNAVMATFNLRLGVWLPSPNYLNHVRVGDLPPPGLRRFSYVIREIFGAYDTEDPFLYVTDGGHIENLGLVELLRRRCRWVFCFDGSGGPRTLVEGVELAYEELGVTITFEKGAFASVHEGSAPIADDKPDDLVAARSAATSVLIGDIAYPALGPDYPAGAGTLVYARAVLTPETEETILEYASRNLRFPNDPTGDQWFDVEQFNNYLLLGRQVGAGAVATMGRHTR